MTTTSLPAPWRTLRTQLVSTLPPKAAAGIDTLIHDVATRAEVVCDYVTRHQSGDPHATTVLLLSRLPMLINVARHARVEAGDYESWHEVQMQSAVTAFLDTLNRVDVSDEHLVHKLYWYSLHSVSASRAEHIETVAHADMTAYDRAAEEDMPAGSIVSDLLALAHRRSGRSLSVRDEEILRKMYARHDVISVAQLAAEMGLKEDAVESRLRRATSRLRAALQTPRTAAAQGTAAAA